MHHGSPGDGQVSSPRIFLARTQVIIMPSESGEELST